MGKRNVFVNLLCVCWGALREADRTLTSMREKFRINILKTILVHYTVGAFLEVDGIQII